jgi:hypothetical protein
MHWRARRAQGTPAFASERRVADAFETREPRGGVDDDATDAAIAHQQVAAEAEPEQRRAFGKGAEKREQVRAIAGLEEHVRRSAHVPGGVARHRFIALHAIRKLWIHHEDSVAHECILAGGFFEGSAHVTAASGPRRPLTSSGAHATRR